VGRLQKKKRNKKTGKVKSNQMSTKEKIGKGEVVGWTLELEWSNGVIEKHGECDDTCASEVDNYLTELERERNE
jgi:hypothetical protein